MNLIIQLFLIGISAIIALFVLTLAFFLSLILLNLTISWMSRLVGKIQESINKK